VEITSADKRAFWRAFLILAAVQPVVVLWHRIEGKGTDGDDLYRIAVGIIVSLIIAFTAVPLARRFPRLLNPDR
jgi:hypothetical protein